MNLDFMERVYYSVTVEPHRARVFNLGDLTSPLYTVNQLQYTYAIHLNTPRRVRLHFVRFSSYQ